MKKRRERKEYLKKYYERPEAKEQWLAYRRTYYKNNPDRARIYKYKKLGATLEDYNRMFELQQGMCAICSKHQSSLKQKLVLDHNHATGKIRDLLCSHCNTRLGYFENKVYATNMINYLDKHNKTEE